MVKSFPYRTNHRDTISALCEEVDGCCYLKHHIYQSNISWACIWWPMLGRCSILKRAHCQYAWGEIFFYEIWMQFHFILYVIHTCYWHEGFIGVVIIIIMILFLMVAFKFHVFVPDGTLSLVMHVHSISTVWQALTVCHNEDCQNHWSVRMRCFPAICVHQVDYHGLSTWSVPSSLCC